MRPLDSQHIKLLVMLLVLAAIFGFAAARPLTAQAGRMCALGGTSTRVHGCFRPRAHRFAIPRALGAVVEAPPTSPIPTEYRPLHEWVEPDIAQTTHESVHLL